jgi:hypothetical protein
MSFLRDPEYLRVGPEVDFGDVNVGYDDVAPLHEAVVTDFLANVGNRIETFDFDRSSIRGGAYFDGGESKDFDIHQRFVNAKIAHESVPDGWRLTTRITTSSYADYHSNKQVMYRVETAQGEVVQAVKAVKFIFGKSELSAFGEDLVEKNTSERKMYERPMTVADCERLVELFVQTGVRNAIDSSKPKKKSWFDQPSSQ